MWERQPGVAAWYERIRRRPSFKTAVEDWMSPTDIERCANEPDPWPKVLEILRAGGYAARTVSVTSAAR